MRLRPIKAWYDTSTEQAKLQMQLPDGTVVESIIAQVGTFNADGDTYTEAALQEAVYNFNQRIQDDGRSSLEEVSVRE